MFNFYNNALGACTSITNNTENIMESFLNQSNNSTIYSASISNVVSAITGNAKNLANIYEAISGACNLFVNEINNLIV